MSSFKFDEQIFAWWWLPEFPDDKVAGYVSVKSGKNVIVHILGMFDSVENWEQGVPLVYGRDTRDGLYTLTEVSFFGQLEPLEKGYGVVKLHSARAFAGAHVPFVDPFISELWFTPTGLKEWAASDKGIEFSLEEDKSAWVARILMKRDPVICEISDDCKLSLEYFQSRSYASLDSGQVEHSCHCRITFTTPTTLEKCFRLMKAFCDFLSFSTRIMSGVESYSAKVHSDVVLNTEPGNDNNTIQVLGLNSALAASSEKRMYGRGGRNYFTLERIRGTFQPMLKAWFDAASKYESAYHLYFAIGYRKSSTYIDHQFFTYVQCLEGFCKKDKLKGRFLEKKEYQEFVDSVIKPFLLENAEKNLAEAMLSKLREVNEFTLREYLSELLQRRGPDFVKRWIPNSDTDSWVSKVIQSRNNFTHVLDKPDQGILMGWKEFIAIRKVLRLLVEAHLLERIGFSTNEIDIMLNVGSEDEIAT